MALRWSAGESESAGGGKGGSKGPERRHPEPGLTGKGRGGDLQPGLTGKGPRGSPLGWTAVSAEAAEGTAADTFFSEMPPWFRWKRLLWMPRPDLQSLPREWWAEQVAKAEAAAVKLSRRSARHVADGGLVPLEVTLRGEAADAVTAGFAEQLLNDYPHIQDEDVEVMCEDVVAALPQGGFGGTGASAGVRQA